MIKFIVQSPQIPYTNSVVTISTGFLVKNNKYDYLIETLNHKGIGRIISIPIYYMWLPLSWNFY